ncbi:uncharacterized protein LOC124460893 [Drosophila willistoni]|uniref:uncharacterized protein LOC124460893 n=1 Tax=Drosophila willistoni TaxID=7260 RepID=UPI001F08074C|nr:uncharacterized protein LOC124460893 [Drosophila willistoni]
MRKIDQNPQISVRSLAKELHDECDLVVSHETVRQAILRHKYSSRVARKKPLLSAVNVEKRLTFATSMLNRHADYWEDVIFCDETKMMLYYNDGPPRVWRIVHGDIAFMKSTMNAEQYLNILKAHLPMSVKLPTMLNSS